MASDDSRYDRLEDTLELALMLQGTLTGIALKDVEAHFGVSRRTAQRMMDAVRRAVGESEFEHHTGDDRLKRWSMMRPQVGDLFRIDEHDLAALDRARGLAAREGDTDTAGGLLRVADKLRSQSRPEWLRRVDPDLEALSEAQGFAFRAGPRPRIDGALLEQLRHSILAQKRVRVRHRKSPGDRAAWQQVGPLGFLYGSQHYLVAWSERRRKVVLFRLARIDAVEVTQDAFAAPGDFDLDAYARQSFGVFQEDPVDVAWRFRPGVAAEARECVFHPDQTLETQLDGSLVVRFRAGGVQEMAWYLLTWGRDVEVLEPARLRRELVKWGMTALRRHGAEVDAELELSSMRERQGVARKRTKGGAAKTDRSARGG